MCYPNDYVIVNLLVSQDLNSRIMQMFNVRTSVMSTVCELLTEDTLGENALRHRASQ